MEEIYYIVEGGTTKGPYSKEALRLLGIGKETFVWRNGMTDWQPAGSLSELNEVFQPADSAFGGYANQEPEVYFAMIGDVQVGPDSIDALIRKGLTESTPVWRNGMADWLPASTQPEIMQALGRSRQHSYAPGMNPGSMPPPPVGFGNSYGGNHNANPGYNAPASHTNWMPWAITATIVGFLCSCIGGVLGIIGIVKANQANDCFARGDVYNGIQANSSARTWTIISLVLAGLGIIINIFYFLFQSATLSLYGL
ncbi:MAG: DUF4339 domain-containing protein [Bacteroidales bacterium]|nr:DUF4339 domain-containing protein [Bacteroidales bacterium]